MFKRILALPVMALAVFFTACHPDLYTIEPVTPHPEGLPEGIALLDPLATETASLLPGDMRPADALPRFSRPIHARGGQDLEVVVDVSEQLMKVMLEGELAYQWPVSTGRKGNHTPRGDYGVEWLSEFHKSSIYNDAPMPYSIFFNGNFAIHGTNDVRSIGQPASAGCVRLIPDDAAVLFNTVKTVGTNNVSIKITD